MRDDCVNERVQRYSWCGFLDQSQYRAWTRRENDARFVSSQALGPRLVEERVSVLCYYCITTRKHRDGGCRAVVAGVLRAFCFRIVFTFTRVVCFSSTRHSVTR